MKKIDVYCDVILMSCQKSHFYRNEVKLELAPTKIGKVVFPAFYRTKYSLFKMTQLLQKYSEKIFSFTKFSKFSFMFQVITKFKIEAFLECFQHRYIGYRWRILYIYLWFSAFHLFKHLWESRAEVRNQSAKVLFIIVLKKLFN